MTDPAPKTPKIFRFADAEQAARAAAGAIISTVKAKPDAVLGLATGATQVPAYEELIRACKAGEVSFSATRSFNLDEYIGLSPTVYASFHATMQRVLFRQIDIQPENAHLPDGMSEHPGEEAEHYEASIAAAGGIDIQLLGVGRNGHIGFNEPGTDFGRLSHCVALHSSTLEANAGFFADGHVPPTAITMGIGTILKARRIVVLATGRAKAPAVKAALYGPVSEKCPASALRLHGNVSWYVDANAHPDPV